MIPSSRRAMSYDDDDLCVRAYTQARSSRLEDFKGSNNICKVARNAQFIQSFSFMYLLLLTIHRLVPHCRSCTPPSYPLSRWPRFQGIVTAKLRLCAVHLTRYSALRYQNPPKPPEPSLERRRNASALARRVWRTLSRTLPNALVPTGCSGRTLGRA